MKSKLLINFLKKVVNTKLIQNSKLAKAKKKKEEVVKFRSSLMLPLITT